jgi:serine/threonine-protein phosphatase 2A regulatory subunit A
MMIATSNHTPTPSLTMVRSLPHGVDELNQMGPFELFQTQLEHGLTEAKVDAMKRLSVVAFALGLEKTQNDLLPYLTTLSMKQPPLEDEILLIFASQLQLLVPNLLHHSAILPLLPILERLAAIEETVVRDEAVKAVNHVVPFLGPSVHLTNMAKRLVASDWFTSKVSAAGMCAVLYEVSRDDDLRYVYRDLCQDDAPMVRRAAAQHLGTFLGKLSFSQVQDLQPIIEQICSDEQDSVRLLAIAGLGKMGPQFPPEWTTQILLPILKSGSTDLSW